MKEVTRKMGNIKDVIHHFRIGFGLGWQQPYDLQVGWSPEDQRYQETADRGTCWGQLLRKGTKSQVWREGMYPVSRLKKTTTN